MDKENLNDLNNIDNMDINQIEALYSDVLEGPEVLITNKCYCAKYGPGGCIQYNCLY